MTSQKMMNMVKLKMLKWSKFNHLRRIEATQQVIVDYPKITKDKSLESRVQTPDAGLNIATATAPRCDGRNSRLNITAMTKTRGLKLASLLHP